MQTYTARLGRMSIKRITALVYCAMVPMPAWAADKPYPETKVEKRKCFCFEEKSFLETLRLTVWITKIVGVSGLCITKSKGGRYDVLSSKFTIFISYVFLALFCAFRVYVLNVMSGAGVSSVGYVFFEVRFLLCLLMHLRFLC